jgi:hypothetical protein
MILSVLVLAAVGILNPSYRGGFMSVALFLFVFAGYVFHNRISPLAPSLGISALDSTNNSMDQNGE